MSFFQENRVKFFYEAIQHGSIRGAADFLNIAPSAVSRQITQLEEELDIVVIERHRRGIKATEAGEQLLVYYKQYLIEQERLLDNLKSLRGLQSGTVKLAIGEGFINVATKAICAFSKKYPNIKIILSTHCGNDVLRKVIDDDAHIGVVFNSPNHPKMRIHYASVQPMVVAVSKDHPINKEVLPISMITLKNYQLALPEIAHGIMQLIEKVEKSTNITLQANVISNSLTALHYYALNGGVTLIPNFMVASIPEWDKTLNNLPLVNKYLNNTESIAFTRVGRQLGAAPTEFLKCLTSLLREELD